MEALYMKTGISWPKGISFGGGDVKPPTTQINAMGRSSINNSATTSSAPQKIEKSASSRFSFKYTLPSLWGNGNDGVVLDDGEEIGVEEDDEEVRERNGSWVLKILRVQSLWKDQEKNGVDVVEEEKEGNDDNVDCDLSREGDGCVCNDDDDEEIEGCKVDEEEEEEGLEFDKDSFSRLLRRVSLTEARLYARMSFLGKLAYSIPKIKSANHLKHHGFRFVTSSLEKKELSTNAEKEQNSTEVQEQENKTEETMQESEKQKISIPQISASAAYHVAASAASYLQSHTRSILSFKSSKDGTENISREEGSESQENAEARSSELASFVATTDSVTAVVAAKEEKKQAVAKELNTASPSPCEWFICDEELSATRFFVIQGSESLASWQANLLFEPIQFEGLDVLVHRGIYEAAKGIYDQMLPDVQDHLKLHGNLAKFRFTGHSLGGSLSLLVNLMLLLRGEVPASSLLPVIMFGAPYVMCGGDQLLRRMGLPRSHVQGINMHRDIVPRAFSCTCPDHIAELLKAVNGNFRNHPCLKNQKLLYSPMGDILILQPEEKFSPHHELLPPGSGLYLLSCSLSDSKDPEKQLQAAKTVFFNSPHPLEILSDRSAYGSDGAIYRDHDMNSYLKCVRAVIRQELNQIRKTKRQHRRRVWWQQITPELIHAGAVVGQRVSLHTVSLSPSRVSGIFHTGRESFKRFSRLVASQHTHLLVVLLFPAQLLVLGTFAVTRLR